MVTMKKFVAVAAVASAAAAGVHFAVAPEHFQEWWGFGAFFVASGLAQLVWAACPSNVAIGICGNAALIALWAISRTSGLPFGPNAGTPEAIGPVDLASVALELSAIVALVANHLVVSDEWLSPQPLHKENT